MKSFTQFLKEGKNAEAIEEVKASIREGIDTEINKTRQSILESFKFIKEEKDKELYEESDYEDDMEKIKEMEDKEELDEEEQEELDALKDKVKKFKKK